MGNANLCLLLLLIISSFHHSTVHSQQWMLDQISTTEPPSPSSSPTTENGVPRIILSIVFGFVTGLIGALLVAFLLKCFIRYMRKTPILKGPVIFSPKIAPKTLQSALAKQDILLGTSSNGKYFKTVLENGLTIAVKKLGNASSPEIYSKSAKRHVQQELEMLAGLRHRNLMSLRAFVPEPNNGFSLVYDYVPSGSLGDAMLNDQLKLNWEIRLKIVVGVIKGLRYLHFECVPQVLHYNLKPTNVILDGEFEPRLADCGLAKLIPNLDRAAAGYNAPEFLQDCRYTDKSDVFSFGVILAVLVTGKDPMDPFFGDSSNGASLGRWLRHLQQAGEAREAIDTSILGDEAEEDEMLMAVRIAAACLSDLPADRPSSEELVPMLTQLNSF